MSARKSRWEVVRTDAGYHARFRASNGKVIVSSEVYRRRHGAENAVYRVAPLHYLNHQVLFIDEREVTP